MDDPWDLTICGRGPLEHLCTGPGVNVEGFQSYEELPVQYAKASAFVFPSLYDSWGVALAEACAAGLPVICTSDCGATADLVCDGHNGVIVPADDASGLERALCWMHANEDRLEDIGHRSIDRAFGFAGTAAAKKWHAMFQEVLAPA